MSKVFDKTETHEELQYALVYEVKEAFIGVNNRLYVCVDGFYLNHDQQYWIWVPLVEIEHKRKELSPLKSPDNYWRSATKELWFLPRKNIKLLPCKQRPKEVLRMVDIVILKAEMTSSHETEGILNENFSHRAESELVYQLNVTNDSGKSINSRDIAYANRESQFGKNHTFIFKTNSYQQRVQGSVLWYLGLPFALAFDVITWPYVLYQFAQYTGSH